MQKLKQRTKAKIEDKEQFKLNHGDKRIIHKQFKLRM